MSGGEEAAPGGTPRVLICDDHPITRQGIRGMLERSGDVEVVGEASDGVQAVELARELGPDVVLMDLGMPRADGVTAMERILERDPAARVLVLTSFESAEDVERAIRAGATGYMLKDAPTEELLRAIRLAARGEAALAPKASTHLMRRMREPQRNKDLNGSELEVLDLVAAGKSNREIANELWVSVETVRKRLDGARGKLGAVDRTNAAAIAAARGLIRPLTDEDRAP